MSHFRDRKCCGVVNVTRVQCEPCLLWYQDIRAFLTALSSQSQLINSLPIVKRI